MTLDDDDSHTHTAPYASGASSDTSAATNKRGTESYAHGLIGTQFPAGTKIGNVASLNYHIPLPSKRQFVDEDDDVSNIVTTGT